MKGIWQKEIQAFCQKHNVSENVVFLTGFNYCVSVFANKIDVLVSSTHSGRTFKTGMGSGKTITNLKQKNEIEDKQLK